MSVTLWVLLALAVALLVWAVGVYNRLAQLRNRMANAFGQIDVQLKRRYDLIPNLVKVAQRYLAHEAATLEAVTRARGAAVGAVRVFRHQRDVELRDSVASLRARSRGPGQHGAEPAGVRDGVRRPMGHGGDHQPLAGGGRRLRRSRLSARVRAGAGGTIAFLDLVAGEMGSPASLNGETGVQPG